MKHTFDVDNVLYVVCYNIYIVIRWSSDHIVVTITDSDAKTDYL